MMEADRAMIVILERDKALARIADLEAELSYIVNALSKGNLGCNCRVGCHLCNPVVDFITKHEALIVKEPNADVCVCFGRVDEWASGKITRCPVHGR